VAIVAAAVGALAAPAGANAATKDVLMGWFTPPRADHLAYYPHQTTVNVGDSVRFIPAGFHTATFLADGQEPPVLFPQVPAPYPATADKAGNPFWWSGSVNKYLLNPQIAFPSDDTTVDGHTFVNTGAPFGPEPFVATFPVAGTFSFYCGIHPRMHGEIRVVDGKPAPANQEERAQQQIAEDTAKAQALEAESSALPNDSGVVKVGPGTTSLELLGFYPSNPVVHVGQTINFVWAPATDVHTVTFGKNFFLKQLNRAFIGPDLVLDPLAALPSEPPGTNPAVHVKKVHGNGYLNSGLIADPGGADQIFGPPEVRPTGGSENFRVRFSEAGSYQFMCAVHGPIMQGTVTVLP